MANKKPNKLDRAKLLIKIRNKYRLLVINDENLEEKFSLLLSPLNVFTWGGTLLIFLVLFGAMLIVFTPLREFIPGYADVTLKKQAQYAALKADSLEQELKAKDWYLENIKAIINGEPLQTETQSRDTTKQYHKIQNKRVAEDSVLRAEIEKEDKYNISFSTEGEKRKELNNYFFFTPLRGLVSSSFDPKIEHYGVDVIAPKNEAIKAALPGTVIFANWTSTDGHVIQLQHSNNLVTIYKHNSMLLKKTGEMVNAGDVIAIIGESGKETSGPHLHFELWFNGKPIDPQDYMIF